VAGEDLDQAPHIDAEFRQAYPTWADLRQHVGQLARIPEFDLDRGLHHLLKIDLASRLHQVPGHQWMLYGSTGLPARVPPDASIPAGFGPATGGIDPVYVMTRSAFDLDLAQLGDAGREGDREQHGQRLLTAMQAVAAPESGTPAGVGLGGLVRYSIADARVVPELGKVYAQITAVPIDARYGVRRARQVDDALTIEVDLSPYKAVTHPVERARRSLLGFEVAGFRPVVPYLTPTVDAMADKICNLAGPPRSSRTQRPPDFHRYKDLFDIGYLISTCPFDADQLRAAIRANHNMPRIGLSDLPVPYALYREHATATMSALPWAREYQRLRQSSPQLLHYPDFTQLRARIGEFFDDLANAPGGASWQPQRGWTLAQQTAESPPAAPWSRVFPSSPQRGSGPTRDTSRDKPASPPPDRSHGRGDPTVR
jgi:hypothetical protein